MPLWYVADGHELRGWTFAKSQKAKNLERDPRATLQVEDGIEYHELKRRDARVRRARRARHRAGGRGLRIPAAGALRGRLGGGADAFREQAKKRVGMRFTPTRVVSWDHSKLGGDLLIP